MMNLISRHYRVANVAAESSVQTPHIMIRALELNSAQPLI